MTASASIDVIPKWDLNDLYASLDDPKIVQDLDQTATGAKAFATDYQGKLSALDGEGLGQAITRYEELSEVLSRVMSYAQLLFAALGTKAQVPK